MRQTEHTLPLSRPRVLSNLSRSVQPKRKSIFNLVLIAVSLSVSLQVFASDVPAAAKVSPLVASQVASGGSSEALIVLTEQADLSGAASLPTKLEKGQYVYNTLRTFAERTQAPIRKMLEQRGIPYQSFYGVNMIKVNADRNQLFEVAARNDVARVEANPMVHSPIPSTTMPVTSGLNSLKQTLAPTGAIEWNVAQVKAPQVWALGYHGEGMVIAGADTGVQWDHVALKSHYRGWNGTSVNHSYSWHDATSDHSLTPIDPQFHGTFTMSEMVGDDGQGNQVGVAPGAKWIACRNMDRHGNGTPATYVECFQFLLAPYPMGHPELANPAMAPDVINNSWDCPTTEGCSPTTLKAIVDALQAAGIFSVAAAGNYGSGCSTVKTPPAIYSSALTVGATDNFGRIATFSSRGPVTVDGSNRMKPEITAPGVNIRGAIAYNNMYQGYWQGTSMAAPHVAAAVALLWQAKPNLVGQIAQTVNYLTQNAAGTTYTQNCGSYLGKAVPNAVFGYGQLDILKAVQAP